MRKVQFIGLFALALAAVVMIPGSAQADTFSLNYNGCTGGCAVPAGQVILTQNGSSVNVEVDLTNAAFVDTGSSHTSFVFDINGAPSITISNLSAGFSYPADSTVNSPFGNFNYGIDCIATGTPNLPAGTPTCGPGASSTVPPPLKFTVSLANGGTLRTTDFGATTFNNNGTPDYAFFAADIYDFKTGNTGAVAAVAEPSTVALLGFGLVGIGTLRRKLKFKLI